MPIRKWVRAAVKLSDRVVTASLHLQLSGNGEREKHRPQNNCQRHRHALGGFDPESFKTSRISGPRSRWRQLVAQQRGETRILMQVVKVRAVSHCGGRISGG